MLEKIRTMVSSLKALMLKMLKCLRKRDVTAFLPPPGGPIAVMSWRSIRWMGVVSISSFLREQMWNEFTNPHIHCLCCWIVKDFGNFLLKDHTSFRGLYTVWGAPQEAALQTSPKQACSSHLQRWCTSFPWEDQTPPSFSCLTWT